MEEKNYWEGKHFAFHQTRECEFFPCHSGADPETFNCLFCYCPLYALGKKCGGNFTVLENGIKDCSSCLVPHGKNSYGYIAGRFSEIAAAVSEKMKADDEKEEDK